MISRKIFRKSGPLSWSYENGPADVTLVSVGSGQLERQGTWRLERGHPKLSPATPTAILHYGPFNHGNRRR